VGFMQGLQQSCAIVLLISNKTMKGIIENAHKKQDNVFVEYLSYIYTVFIYF